MLHWTFKDGMSGLPIVAKKEWIKSLKASLCSHPTPNQSGYFVRTGATTKKGNVVFGGNHEIGIAETITHGEEAVIARALDEFGPDDPIEVIAFTTDYNAGIGSPCGNCRDAIYAYTNLHKLVVIEGQKNGGEAIVVKGKIFFKDVRKLSHPDKNEIGRLLQSKGFLSALCGFDIAYDIYSKTKKHIYGVAIVSENGLVFRGSLREDASYHSVYPISSAIETFRNSSDDLERFFVKEIVIVSKTDVPDVLYKDRQHAMEFAEAIGSMRGNHKTPIPVFIISFDEKKREAKEAYRTNTTEWLPYRFSAGNFGMSEKMKEGFKKLKQQKGGNYG